MPHDSLARPLRVFRHEAGTPLAVIGGALRQLDRTELSDDQQDLLHSALRQWEVLQRLLDQLHLVDGEVQLETGKVELVALAEEVVRDLSPSVLREHRTSVHGPDGAVHVDGDAARLRQVLLNLLDNAAKYSPEGTAIHVTVSRDGDAAVMSVTDEGSGVSEPDAVRIFERWERASVDAGGLGLGLYVVSRLVDAHGGDVRAEPAPEGQGAQFVVQLPTVGP